MNLHKVRDTHAMGGIKGSIFYWPRPQSRSTRIQLPSSRERFWSLKIWTWSFHSCAFWLWLPSMKKRAQKSLQECAATDSSKASIYYSLYWILEPCSLPYALVPCQRRILMQFCFWAHGDIIFHEFLRLEAQNLTKELC